MWKYLCWPCRMPSFILRGTGVSKVVSDSKTSKTVPEPSGNNTTQSTQKSQATLTAEQTAVEIITTPKPADGKNINLPPTTPDMPELVTTASAISTGAHSVHSDAEQEIESPQT